VSGMDFVSAHRIALIVFAENNDIPLSFLSFILGSEYINREQFRFLFHFV
jgi:hypothetical protein